MDQKKSMKARTAKQQALDRRRAAAHADQKEKMLIAAAQVFCERGFDAAGMDEIAARIGLKKPRLYFHFKKKTVILQACVDEALLQWRRAIAQMKERSSSELTIRSIIERYADVAFSDFGFCAIFIGTNSLVFGEIASLRDQKATIDAEFKKLLAHEASGNVRSQSDIELCWLIGSSVVHGIALLKMPQVDKCDAFSRALGAIPAFNGQI